MKTSDKPAIPQKRQTSRVNPTIQPARLGRKGKLELELYLADETPRSLTVFANLRRLCQEYLAGQCKIKVFNLEKNPELARQEEIIALPTLVRKWPSPIKKILGDLSDTERVLAALGVK